MRDTLLSPFTGIFSTQGPVPLRPHDPAIPCWAGTLPRWGAEKSDLAVGGAGWSSEHAASAGLGEAIERWRSRPTSRDHTVEATFANWPLDEPAIHPREWTLFHAEQYALPGFPFEGLTSQSRCRWVCCRDVRTGEPIWMPVDFVYLDHPDGVHRFGPAISTGLSAGRIGHPVLLRGLQEAIERDALVGAWWGKYPLIEVPFEDILERFEPSRVRALRRPNLRYRAYRIVSPFSNHVTMVTLQGREEVGFCFSVGSACRETLLASFEKSILEAIQGRHLVRHLLETGHDHLFHRGLPVSFQGHALFYSLHRNLLDSTILESASGERAEWTEEAEETQTLLERLRPRSVCVRNVTPAELASLGLDWLVLRVVVPGLQPLHGHHGYPFLGGQLWPPRGLAEWYAQLPHPFA